MTLEEKSTTATPGVCFSEEVFSFLTLQPQNASRLMNNKSAPKYQFLTKRRQTLTLTRSAPWMAKLISILTHTSRHGSAKKKKQWNRSEHTVPCRSGEPGSKRKIKPWFHTAQPAGAGAVAMFNVTNSHEVYFPVQTSSPTNLGLLLLYLDNANLYSQQ